MLPVHVFDYVIEQVGTDIGRTRPEQGGALLGLRGRDVLTAFVHDAHAHVTRVEYSNTSWLLEEIVRREASGTERFKGIVHSHPLGMPHPSGQDHREYGRTLESVSELGRYIAPIVTHDVHTPGRPHELFTDTARMSFFGAVWAARGVRLDPMRPVVVPLAAAVRQAGLPWTPDLPVTDRVNGVDGVRIPLPADPHTGAQRHLFVTPDFPVTAPLLLEEGPAGHDPGARSRGAREVSVRELVWDHRIPELERLGHALHEPHTQAQPSFTPLPATLTTPAPELRPEPDGEQDRHQNPMAAPPTPAPASLPAPAQAEAEPTRPPVRAAADPPTPIAPEHPPGWLRRRALRLGIGRSRAVHAGLFARTGGLLSPELAGAHVLLVGVGSVGSYLADVLVRSGIGRLTLVDPDRVEASNVGRALFGVRDIGRNKAKVTARRLRRINRKLSVDVRPYEVARLDNHSWQQLIAGAHLVIAATDDNAAQQRLNHLSYFVGRPAVFVGLYEGAAGGEIVYTTPGSPCWSCATGGVRERLGDLGHQPRTDYGTGRTYAVPGLLPDIQHLASSAAKVALSLLHEPDGPERIGGFLSMPLREGLSMVQFGMEPDHWFFPMILDGVPGQHAFQSVWLRTGSRPDCAVCGNPALRSDPGDYAGTGDDSEITRAQQQALAERRRTGSSRAAHGRR
ncbi:HesA/MoeB/ThiF family protein [Streptomyces sp. NPDC090022]|uniref:HesA/MoeB/ThiF family protein n=1 Tax=Streptomyces sp. NPDC090022 TaxID=3365920 RepID=UPI00382EA353